MTGMLTFCSEAAASGPAKRKTNASATSGPRLAIGIEQQPFEGQTGRVSKHRNRLGALAFDLGDDRIEERGVARVVVRFVESDGHPRGPRPTVCPPRGASRRTPPTWRTPDPCSRPGSSSLPPSSAADRGRSGRRRRRPRAPVSSSRADSRAPSSPRMPARGRPRPLPARHTARAAAAPSPTAKTSPRPLTRSIRSTPCVVSNRSSICWFITSKTSTSVSSIAPGSTSSNSDSVKNSTVTLSRRSGRFFE